MIGAPGATRPPWWLWTVLCTAVVALLGLLVRDGVLWPNRVLAARHDVRGVDVSRWQGEIDWELLAEQDLDFAYLKATEGSSHVDERFAQNWHGAGATSLLVGAYHFMSFESPGEAQAANVVRTVPALEGTLPPVVDLEPYGPHVGDLPSAESVHAILDPLLAAPEEHYGAPPVIYTTQDAYDAYLRDGYPRNPVWIRSVLVPPTLPDGRDWTFWQYSNRDRLPGYDGEEEYIDLNVFAGTATELRALALE